VRKVISISLTVLLVAALFRFSIATHYCGGEVVNTTISFSGNSVSCCMEAEISEDPLYETRFNSYCCNDIITSYGVDSHFTPTQILIPKLFHNISEVLTNPYEKTINFSALSETTTTSARPPGLLMFTRVDLSDICVYRI
jgi:hypothetical protein